MPAAAQETDARVPPPEGYIETTVDLMAAQALARACPTLSVNPIAAQRRSEEVVERLTEAGIDADNISTRMEDPTEAIVAGRDAFLERTGLADGAPPEAACAAGQGEVEAGTGVGGLLVELGG